MNSSQFKKNEFKKFCATIGFKPMEIHQLIDQVDNYYHEWIEEKIDKKTGALKKYNDGTVKQRTIRPPLRELKAVQTNIKNKILAQITLPDCVHGGVKGRSNITNAKTHQGNKFQFTTDLQDFFPGISYQRVYNSFLKLKFSTHFSHWLTKLTTWKYSLPQGAPTSTHIANLVFLPTDCQLIEFCIKHGITYTRYIDDLTFSSQQDFQPILNDILQIVKSNEYKLNYRKTKYSGNQTVTGIKVFLNKIEAPEIIQAKARTELGNESNNIPYTNYINNIKKTNDLKRKSKSGGEK